MSGLIVLIALYALLLLLVVLLLFAGYGVVAYNRFVKLRTGVQAALSDVDVLLKKRFDLIPNLVETVRGYADHEESVFSEVADLRSRASQVGSVRERAELEGGLTGLFKSLFAVAESYPQLQADENFRRLQAALREIEDGLEVARRSYNDLVRRHNIVRDAFPSNLIGRLFGFDHQEFFEDLAVEERTAPRVDFSSAD